MNFFREQRDIFISVQISIFFLLLGCAIYLCNIFFEVPKIIRGYVPDFCWMFSFVAVLSCTVKGLLKKHYILFSAIVCISVSIVFELMQKSGIVGGTFDIFDILVYTAAAATAALILKIINKRSKKQ